MSEFSRGNRGGKRDRNRSPWFPIGILALLIGGVCLCAAVVPALSGIWPILAAILVLGLLILLHEIGHFASARILGIPVREFAVGFGPKLWSHEGKHALYSVRLLPIGGFCAYYGEDEELSDPRAYNSHPAWKRLITVVSGPLMNMIAGVVFTFILLAVLGQSVVVPVVGSVEEGTPAQQAGILPGDEIVGVGGVIMEGDVTSIRSAIQQNGLAPLTLSLRRDGAAFDVMVEPYRDAELEQTRIGIVFGVRPTYMEFGPAITESWDACIEMAGEMLGFFKNLFFRGEGVDGVTGPVGTISIISQYVGYGLETVMRLAVLISINLGLVNLLPLPALDGGRLIFILIEIVFRKPVPRDKEAWVHVGGLVVLLGIVALFTVRDIARIIGGGG